MSEATEARARTSQQKVAAGLRRRYRAELRFRAYGVAAVSLGILFVVFLFYSIVSKGYTAFEQTFIRLEVSYAAATIDPAGTHSPDALAEANYATLVRAALRAEFPAVSERAELRKLYDLLSNSAEATLRERVRDDPQLVGRR